MKDERLKLLLERIKGILADRDSAKAEEFRFYRKRCEEVGEAMAEIRLKTRDAFIDGEALGRIQQLINDRYFSNP